MESGPRRESEIYDDESADQQGETVQKVSGKGGGPHLKAVDASDAHLPVGKFEETGKISLHIGRCQTLRQEDDLAPAAFDHRGERVVVAEGVLPGIEHANLFENRATDRGASASTEVFVVRTEHGDNRSVPCGEKGGREAIVVWQKPAHGGGSTDTGIRERSDEMMEPAFSRTAIGIGEDQDFELLG